MSKKQMILSVLFLFAAVFVTSVIIFSNQNLHTFDEEKSEYQQVKKLTLRGKFIQSFKASGPIHLIQIQPSYFSQEKVDGFENTIGLIATDSSSIFILSRLPGGNKTIDSVAVQNFEVDYYHKNELTDKRSVEQLRRMTMETTRQEVEAMIDEKLVWLDQ